MTQRIEAVDGPKGEAHLKLTLLCEQRHGMYGGAIWVGTGPDYLALRGQAGQSGWKKTLAAGWAGPCCSGRMEKTPTTSGGDWK